MSHFIKNEYPKKDVLTYSLLICQRVTEKPERAYKLCQACKKIRKTHFLDILISRDIRSLNDQKTSNFYKHYKLIEYL